MTSTQIDYFLSAAQYLSFTRTAEEFHTTQPTISRQIALLEEELALPLFHRDGRFLRLTQEGALLQVELNRSRQMVDAALYRARQLGSGLSGSLSVGCLTTIETDIYVVPPIISFAEDNPNVELSMELGSFSVLRKHLDSGRCDLVFTLGFDLAAYENVSHLVCYRPLPMLVMSREHPMAQREDCSIVDFAGDTFLLPDNSECFGRGSVLREFLTAYGIPNARIGYVRNQESLMLNIRAGRGVSILTSCQWSLFGPKYRFLPLPGKPSVPTPVIAAIWKKENQNPVLPSLLRALENCKDIDVFKN